ncbi:tail protein X [Xylella fastidiosa]|uniref:tail protein X n=1 Tax=Xylella fastidiosa TaxID=2371 RepID=UPI00132653F2|nr:phage tail protein [Xylella fastidiosa subsp. multiplex]
MSLHIYLTRHGDTVDWLAWKYYARTDATIISAIYEANHGLAAWGPVLPEAIAITLPDPVATPRTIPGVTLWE